MSVLIHLISYLLFDRQHLNLLYSRVNFKVYLSRMRNRQVASFPYGMLYCTVSVSGKFVLEMNFTTVEYSWTKIMKYNSIKNARGHPPYRGYQQ